MNTWMLREHMQELYSLAMTISSAEFFSPWHHGMNLVT